MRAKARGFTLIELLVVVAIVAVLGAILYPVFAKGRDFGRRAVCQSNMRQIGMAFSLYCKDYDGAYPNNGDPYLWMGRRWRWVLKPYLLLAIAPDPNAPADPNKSIGGTPRILICPSDLTSPQTYDSTSYGYSAAFYHSPEQINQMQTADLWQLNQFPAETQRQSSVKYPGQKAMLAEWLSNHDADKVSWWDWRGTREYLFADGHVQYLASRTIRPAGNNLPDINLTIDGIAGRDL